MKVLRRKLAKLQTECGEAAQEIQDGLDILQAIVDVETKQLKVGGPDRYRAERDNHSAALSNLKAEINPPPAQEVTDEDKS